MELRGFKGISFPFRFNPVGGVATSTTSPTDFTHIKESIIQIVKTRIGERSMETKFGSHVYNYLFENVENITNSGLVKQSLIDAIETWEKRVEVRDLNVVVVESAIFIDLTVYVKKYLATDEVRVMFRREG